MSLLREIQDAATDETVNLSAVLRKCKVLAARLGHRPLSQWIDNELNGYDSTEDVPPYRHIRVESYGTLINPVRIQDNMPIPPACMPEKYREAVTQDYLMSGVATYESLISDSESDLKIPWPADIIGLVADKIYTNATLVAAWKHLSKSTVVGMLDIVRNKLLTFALEIEAEAPAAGEAKPGEHPLSEEKVSHIFQTIIIGDVNTVVSGKVGTLQQQTINIQKDDFESLKKYLASIEVSTDDIKNLESAISDDPPPKDRSLGPKVAEWLGKMVAKTASGGWKVATSVAGNILTKALMKYYGLS